MATSTAIRAIIEMELNGFLGGWTDVSGDVIGDIVGSRGLPGTSPTDRVAKVGTMSLTMNNAEDNSAGLLGYYSPGHANCRSGFAKNIGVRFSVAIADIPLIQFTGRLEVISPTTGIRGERQVALTVVDFMNETVKKRLSTLTLETNITEAAAFEMILATIPLQPRATQVGAGVDVIPYVFDTVKDDRTTPMSEFVRLSNSTLAIIYVQRDGTMTYEPRGVRATNITPILTLTPADYLASSPPEIDDDRSKIINRVTAAIHPRTVGTTPDVVLYEITAAFVVTPNANMLVRGYYTEEGLRVRRAGGLDMLPAVATTDYLFNTAADGSGTNVTASVTVDTIFTANSVLFTINAPVACFCTKLQSRGTQIVDTANMSVEIEDAASIALVGEVSLALDMPYNADPVFGNEVVQYLLFLSQTNQKRVNRQPLLLNAMSEERAMLMAVRAISDRIIIQEPMTALSAPFFINGINFEFTADRLYTLTWIPVIADATNYWFLGIAGYSELGYTTRLGFGLIIGHTDVAHIDSHEDAAHSDTAHSDTHGDTIHYDTAHGDAATHGDSHADSHSDVAHGDTAHSDVTHVDGAHSDGYNDVAHNDSHSDVAHGDSHGDVAHVDTAHGDAGHGDIPFQGYTDIAHTDTPHTDVGHEDFHFDYTDVPVPHDDEHGDASHEDIAYGDVTHIDDGGNPHVDDAHSDVAHADGAHTNTHGDDAHGDSHGDTSHTNTHGDTPHSDTAHTDVTHNDSHGDSHGDVHDDATGHSDSAHLDTAHSDSHGDVSHIDVAYNDVHGDVAHGDQN